MPGRGRPPKIPIEEVIKLKKENPKLSNVEIGRRYGVKGQSITMALKRHQEKIVTKPKVKSGSRAKSGDQIVTPKVGVTKSEIENIKRDLRAEFEKENVTLRRALIKAKILKPVIPPCPGCNDPMKDYGGGGWDGHVYRAQCKRCGKWQRV